MPWDERPVTSLEAFVRELESILSPTVSERTFWFRGQSDASWPLLTSFLRSTQRVGFSGERAIALEMEALKTFHAHAHLFVSPHLLAQVRTIPCWWALMQHHHAPTRLLDWTVSPYVAAYFAAQDEGHETDGAVWCFCNRELRESFEKIYGTIPEFEAAEAPDWYKNKLAWLNDKPVVIPLTFAHASSERIVAQQGRFTMCFKVDEPQDCILDCVGAHKTRKLVIAHKDKRKFLLRLKEMNITGAALFPGVDGLGRSVRELVSLSGCDEASHEVRRPIE